MEDDVYNGYFLPKDSIVLGNAWCVILALPAMGPVCGIDVNSKKKSIQGDPTRR